jgi:hypothetical protein
MKIKDLIRELQALEKFNPDMEVFLQKDPEGNGYSPLQGVDGDVIVRYDSHEGDYQIYDTNWTPDEACMELEEWEQFLGDNMTSVVLYPRY